MKKNSNKKPMVATITKETKKGNKKKSQKMHNPQ
jgi:hypothetical protein